jgi:hypothetical protein
MSELEGQGASHVPVPTIDANQMYTKGPIFTTVMQMLDLGLEMRLNIDHLHFAKFQGMTYFRTILVILNRAYIGD